MANIVGLVGGCVTTLSGIPQIYQMYTTRETKAIGWTMLSMWTTGLSMTTFYGIFSQQIPVWLPSTISLGMTISMMGIKYVYENQASYQSYTEV
jgi:uncharacterized protein with PQ loop repeat